MTKDNYQQPSLLRTCSQIRSEASSIYYVESAFELMIQKFDSTPATSWFQHSHGYSQKMSTVWDGIDEGGTWSNLLNWLRRKHEGKVEGLEIREDASLLERQDTCGQVSLLFDQLEILKGMPWDTVRRVLEKHREAIVVRGGAEVLGSDEKES